MDIPAYCHRAVHRLHVGLLYQNLLHLRKQGTLGAMFPAHLPQTLIWGRTYSQRAFSSSSSSAVHDFTCGRGWSKRGASSRESIEAVPNACAHASLTFATHLSNSSKLAIFLHGSPLTLPFVCSLQQSVAPTAAGTITSALPLAGARRARQPEARSRSARAVPPDTLGDALCQRATARVRDCGAQTDSSNNARCPLGMADAEQPAEAATEGDTSILR